MKPKFPPLFLAFLSYGFLLQTVITSAAEVTFSSYTATGSTDTSWINVSGYDSIVAGNAGGASTSFGEVNWGAMAAGNLETSANGVTINISAPYAAWPLTTPGFYSGGPDLLNYGAYSGTLQENGVDYTINLSGLTVGKNYKVQFVLADTRDNNGHATILAKGANVTGNSVRTRYSYTDGQFAVITASFTADAATAQFQPGQRWGNDVPNATFISGVHVLAAPNPLLTWDNGTSNFIWSASAANWTGSAWDNGTLKNAIFGATGTGNITLGEPISAKDLTFDAPGYTITGETLSLTAPIITTNKAATISSTIDGVGSLIKEGTATLTLSGANLFSGSTTVNTGTLALGNNLALQYSSFNTASVGTLDLSAVNTPTLGGLAGSGNFTLPANVTSLTLNPQSGSLTYSGNLSGGAAGVVLVKSGAGSQTLSGSSDHSGGTSIIEGALVAGKNSALGSGTIILEGGTLSAANSPTLANAIQVKGTGVLDTPSGSNLFLNGDFTGSGTVTKTGDWSLILGGDNSGFSGTFIHSTSNTYLATAITGSATAAWEITSGVLAASISSTNATVFLGSLSGSGTLANSGSNSTTTFSIGTLGTDTTFSGNIQDQYGGTNNRVAITKTGSGTLTLAGNNSYTGDTTVSEGTLSLANANLADASTVTVAAGAVLNLTHGATDIVGTLVLGGTTYTSGTFSAATHSPFISGSGIIQVGATPADPFYSWMSTNYPGIVSPDNQPGADPDNDGISNLVEYVLQGGDPNASNPGILPTLDASGANFVFTFNRREAATGTTQVFQYSPDLGATSWTDIAVPGGEGVVVGAAVGGVELVQITVLKNTRTKLFGRLKVSQ